MSHIEIKEETEDRIAYVVIENGVEVMATSIEGKGQVTEARSNARQSRISLARYLARKHGAGEKAPKVARAEIVAGEPGAEEHTHDDWYADKDHGHPFPEHEHSNAHDHDEFATLSRSITEHDLSHTEQVNELKGQFLRHTHEGYVGPDHPHHDIQADINLLNVRMRVQEEHQHALTLPPDYNSLKTEVRDLREEVVVLRSFVSSLRAELTKAIGDTADALRLEMKNIERQPHTHEQYATKVELSDHVESISKLKTFRVVSNDKDETGQKITKMVEVG